MYTSYAKDIFIAMIGQKALEEREYLTLMALAIQLVRQAREAFS